jgi:hypothetical protein
MLVPGYGLKRKDAYVFMSRRRRGHRVIGLPHPATLRCANETAVWLFQLAWRVGASQKNRVPTRGSNTGNALAIRLVFAFRVVFFFAVQ